MRSRPTPKSGSTRLEKWLRQAQLLFVEVSQTIREHLEGICNYFISRTTSGVMEGINTRIKLIMRQGYGFANFKNFRLRLLACLGDKSNLSPRVQESQWIESS